MFGAPVQNFLQTHNMYLVCCPCPPRCDSRSWWLQFEFLGNNTLWRDVSRRRPVMEDQPIPIWHPGRLLGWLVPSPCGMTHGFKYSDWSPWRWGTVFNRLSIRICSSSPLQCETSVVVESWSNVMYESCMSQNGLHYIRPKRKLIRWPYYRLMSCSWQISGWFHEITTRIGLRFSGDGVLVLVGRTVERVVGPTTVQTCMALVARTAVCWPGLLTGNLEQYELLYYL